MSLENSVWLIVLGALVGFGGSWIKNFIEAFRRAKYDKKTKELRKEIKENGQKIKRARKRFDDSVSRYSELKRQRKGTNK